MMNFTVEIADETHVSYATTICQLIADSARTRGTGRGKRSPEKIIEKIRSGQAIIALANHQLAGFSYIDAWDEDTLVVHTGLIIAPEFRAMGLAKKIKMAAIHLTAVKYPKAKLFSITTSMAVMKINSELGYRPVTYDQLPKDQNFWKGCESCPNYSALRSKNNQMCFCTAMILEKIEQRINGSTSVLVSIKK